MRVLHISSPKTWRGGEQQLMYLVDELNKLGVWQVVMCPFNSSVHQYCLKHHINHQTYFKGFSANPMVAFRVNHLCKRERVELIHVHDSHAHNFAILNAVLTNNSVPIIVSRRVDFAIQHTPMSMFKYNHQQIARILCVSDAIRAVMEPDIEDKSKLVTVHSGIDLGRIQPPAEKKLREEFEIPNDHVVIANVAALAPHKDYPTFFAVARELLNRGLKATFLAIGEGPARKEAELSVRELGLEGDVRLCGFRSDVIALLHQVDVFLMTSKTEGLGTSILDALAAGVPVVATNAGGIGEIIEHDVSGLLAPVAHVQALADAVMRVWQDAELRGRLIEGGKQHVQRFTKAETARKTFAIYGEVLGSDRAPR